MIRVESRILNIGRGIPLQSLKATRANSPPMGPKSEAASIAIAECHVTPAELGAGYMAFFFYSGLVGVLAMALAAVVAVRSRAFEPQRTS